MIKKINRELCYIPNIADALSFSYKKTVGSLTLESVCSYGRHLYLYNTTLIIKILLQKHKEVDNVIEKISKISNSFSNAVYFNKVYINISHLIENYEIKVVDEYISKINLNFIRIILKYHHNNTIKKIISYFYLKFNSLI